MWRKREQYGVCTRKERTTPSKKPSTSASTELLATARHTTRGRRTSRRRAARTSPRSKAAKPTAELLALQSSLGRHPKSSASHATASRRPWPLDTHRIKLAETTARRTHQTAKNQTPQLSERTHANNIHPTSSSPLINIQRDRERHIGTKTDRERE